MLVIDKSLANQRFILTLSEVNQITSGSTIEFKNLFDNTDYSFPLPTDSSLYPERFNEFIFDTPTFSALTIGTYTYQVKDASNNITDQGILKVDGIVQSVIEDVNDFYIMPPASNDDIIVVE